MKRFQSAPTHQEPETAGKSPSDPGEYGDCNEVQVDKHLLPLVFDARKLVCCRGCCFGRCLPTLFTIHIEEDGIKGLSILLF